MITCNNPRYIALVLPFRAPAHSLCGAALSGSRELEPEAAFPGVPEPQETAR